MINLFNKLRAVYVLDKGNNEKISFIYSFFISMITIFSYYIYIQNISIFSNKIDFIIMGFIFQFLYIIKHEESYINKIKFNKKIITLNKILFYYIFLFIGLLLIFVLKISKHNFTKELLYDAVIILNFINLVTVPIVIRKNRGIKNFIVGLIILFLLIFPTNYVLSLEHSYFVKLLLLIIINIFTVFISVMISSHNYKSRIKENMLYFKIVRLFKDKFKKE